VSRRRTAVWLLVLPVMLAGSQLAHALAYRIAYPNARERVHELLLRGHGYLDYLPLVLGIGCAVELVALAFVALDAARRRRHRPLPAWAFALLPALGFTLQELCERWPEGASFPWWAVLEPTFWIGLLLQLPIGFVAYLIARLLQRAAETAGTLLARRSIAARITPFSPRQSVAAVLGRLPLLAAGWSARGPPTEGP